VGWGGWWLTPPHKLYHHMASKELSKKWPFLQSILYGFGTFVSNQTLSLNCENIYEFSSGLISGKVTFIKNNYEKALKKAEKLAKYMIHENLYTKIWSTTG
jgi:hypothetical protein